MEILMITIDLFKAQSEGRLELFGGWEKLAEVSGEKCFGSLERWVWIIY